MINKKLLAAASVAVAVASSSAFAKTEGHYAGLDLLRSKSEHNYKNSGVQFKNFENSATGVGLNYRYAFNMNNFFIAPGAFIEKIGTEATETAGFDKAKIDYRYGLKADVGYDIADAFSVYFTGGVSNTHYEIDWSQAELGKKSGNEAGYFYGLGLGYEITKEIGVRVEYNIQSLDLEAPKTIFGSTKAETDLSVMKVGVSYHF